jgi:RNA polymerase sigma-70 factor (ECF subfamily)
VDELFERHGRMVYGVCRAMLRDVHEAEDAAQQTFLSAYRALLGGARVRDAGAWLATIARNECRARIAAGMRAPLPVADEDLEAIVSPLDDVERRQHAEQLRAALAELPDRQREAIVLRDLYGLRYGEVARALGLSRPATEALLFRARRSLRVRLRPAVGLALAVPVALREELAAAIPGFAAGSGVGAAGAGVAGGILGKLVATSAGAKVATAAVAVGTVGVVGTVESGDGSRRAQAPAPARSAPAAVPEDDDDARGDESDGKASSDRSGRRGGEAEDERDDDRVDDRSGPGGGEDGEHEERERAPTSGPSGDRDESSGPGPSGEGGSSGPGSGDEDEAGHEEESSGSGSGSGSGAGSSGDGGEADDEEPEG